MIKIKVIRIESLEFLTIRDMLKSERFGKRSNLFKEFNVDWNNSVLKIKHIRKSATFT